MSKIRKALKAVSLIIRKPVLLNRILQDPDTWKEYVNQKYSLGHGLRVIDPADITGKNYSERLPVFTFLDGGSLVTDIALLKSLAGTIPGCKYFEIGTWRGESAINVAESAEEVYTMNLSAAEMRDLGLSEEYISQQAFFSQLNKSIHHIRANSQKFDYLSLGKKFDLIFVDGSHHYEDVRQDTRNIFRYLVHDESVVVWHDYARTPEEVRFEVLAGILDGLPREFHKFLYHAGHTKSAIFIKNEFPFNELKNPVKPDYFYSVEIKRHAVEKGQN